MRIVVLLACLVLLLGCLTPDQKEFQRLSSLTTQEAVYRTVQFANDSFSEYSLDVSILNGDFMLWYVNDLDAVAKMKLFELYQPYRINAEGDSVLKRTFINYDVNGDSIRYYEVTEKQLGVTKCFEVNGEQYKVLKQPRWIWTKSIEPNCYEFFSREYGLILTLKDEEKTELIKLFAETGGSNLEELIQAVESDEEFFCMKMEGLLNEQVHLPE